METVSLRLRQFVPQDAAVIFSLSEEPAYRTWLPSQVYRDQAHALSALQFLIGQYASPGNPKQGAYVLAIEHRASGALIGHVGFSPLDGDVEIGFAIGESFQRQGFAAEAIIAATRWAFATFALDRILGIAAAANTASQRTLLKARFVYTGDRTMNFQGVDQDVGVFALSGSP